jgi:hypothetical protein
MSWSVGAVGRTPAVADDLVRQLNQYKCSEPEESVKQAAGATLAAALAAQEPGTVVKVLASGSQSQYQGKDGSPVYKNQLSLSVEPLYNFIE